MGPGMPPQQQHTAEASIDAEIRGNGALAVLTVPAVMSRVCALLCAGAGGGGGDCALALLCKDAYSAYKQAANQCAAEVFSSIMLQMQRDIARDQLQVLHLALTHRDSDKRRPLWDSIESGIAFVEFDVHLVRGQILVGHDKKDLHPFRTIQTMYLDPLKGLLRTHRHVFEDGVPLTLFVDVKTDAVLTYAVLKAIVIENYLDIVEHEINGELVPRPVRLVLTGNRPVNEILNDTELRVCGFDGRLRELGMNIPSRLCPVVSDNWLTSIPWWSLTLSGVMGSSVLRSRLLSIVEAVRKEGKLLRFWGTPDRVSYVFVRVCVSLMFAKRADDLDGLRCWQPLFWTFLWELGAGSIIVNTDRPRELAVAWQQQRTCMEAVSAAHDTDLRGVVH